MNTKELRLGNIIKGFTTEEVRSISGQIINLYAVGCYSPVELTEEWLLKFGFKKVQEDKYGCHYENEECWIYLNHNGFDLELITGDERFNLLRTYKYVHQLQNLYFAITGKELVI